jgi:hypothetical protein
MNDWFNITDVSDNIIITFNHTTTDKDFDYYLDYYKNIYNSNKNVRVVFDCRNIIYISIKNIYKKIVLMKIMQPIHQRYLDKFYIIVSSEYMKSIINFAFSVVKPVSEYEILDTLPSGFT